MRKPYRKWMGVVLVVCLLLAGQQTGIVKAYDELTSDETWSGTKTLDQDVVVPSGMTLTITPGTTVAMECTDSGNYPDGADSYTDRIEIIVMPGGTLNADGATFRAVDSTTEGCWYGIEFAENSSGYIRDSTIQNGVTGITVYSDIEITGNTIDQMHGRDASPSTSSSGETACGIYAHSGGSTISISANTISHIFGGDGRDTIDPATGGSGGFAYGIYARGYYLDIDDNVIENIYGGNGGLGASGINGDNGDDGLSAGDSGTDGANGTSGSRGGTGGGSYGIYLDSLLEASITNTSISTIISGNGGNGGTGGAGGNGGDGVAGFSIDTPQQGGNGGSGGNGSYGGSGGWAIEAAGVYSSAESLQFDRNTIQEVYGGTGGIAGAGGNGGSGGNGGDGSYSSEVDGGNGGMGGDGGSGGAAGNVGDGGDSMLIHLNRSTLSSFTRNLFSETYAGSENVSSPGGDGGAGGKGGDGGMGIEVDGVGGQGGNGGNGGHGSNGGEGGFASGIYFYNISSDSAAVTDSIVSDVYSTTMYVAGSGGNGGDGGDGGLNSGTAGNGGDGGDGGLGGDANGAALVMLNYVEVSFINDTFHYPDAPTNGGDGGAAGMAGDAGTGDVSGESGSPGVIGSAGDFSYAMGMMSSRNEDPSDIYVYNCIFDAYSASNSIGIREAADDANINFDYTDLWGWNEDYHPFDESGAGSHNISADPQFKDTESLDFHLQEGSPCIDVGDNDAPGIPSVDYDGIPRIIDGNGDDISIVDLGALEFRKAILYYFPLFMKD